MFLAIQVQLVVRLNCLKMSLILGFSTGLCFHCVIDKKQLLKPLYIIMCWVGSRLFQVHYICWKVVFSEKVFGFYCLV